MSDVRELEALVATRRQNVQDIEGQLGRARALLQEAEAAMMTARKWTPGKPVVSDPHGQKITVRTNQQNGSER